MNIYDGSKDKKVFPTNHTVAVISANRIINDNRDSLTIRNKGREDWSLFYCETGKMYFDESVLESGQIWIYPPNIPHKYAAYSKDNVTYHYLHFTGSDLKEIFSSLNIATSQSLDTENQRFLKTLEHIESAMTDDSPLSKIISEYNTLHLITQIAQNEKQITREGVIKRVIDDMEHSFANKYDVSYYARMLNLSISRFNHLFKEETGVSPYSFLLKIRLKNAAVLLLNTNLKISKIAEQCGFEDSLYFTQAFKKAYNVTPTTFRKLSS